MVPLVLKAGWMSMPLLPLSVFVVTAPLTVVWAVMAQQLLPLPRRSGLEEAPAVAVVVAPPSEYLPWVVRRSSRLVASLLQ